MGIFDIFKTAKVRKNIIFIAVDGVRGDMIDHGEAFKLLKKESTFFPNMITYAPYSLASFHGIFSGIYGTRNGVDCYFGGLDFKSDQCKTLTEYLHENGFITIGDSMKEMLIPSVGFDNLTVQEAGDNILAKHENMINQVHKEKTENKKNFFLFLHASQVHDQLVANVAKKFDDESPEYFGQFEKNKKRYLSYQQDLDKYLTTILAKLKEMNLLDDSLLFVFSDHGSSLGERKGERIYGSFCYDYTLKTFLLASGSVFEKGKKIENMIRNVDITPTILDILKIPKDNKKLPTDGESIIPIIKAEEKVERVAFSETGGLNGPWPSPKEPNVHSIRTPQWKLIYNRTPKTFELYDLINDPNEQNNCYGKHSQLEGELWKIMKKYRQDG